MQSNDHGLSGWPKFPPHDLRRTGKKAPVIAGAILGVALMILQLFGFTPIAIVKHASADSYTSCDTSGFGTDWLTNVKNEETLYASNNGYTPYDWTSSTAEAILFNGV